MIAQCPACLKLVDIRHGRADGDRVGLPCPSCGHTTWLEESDEAGTRPASPVTKTETGAAPASTSSSSAVTARSDTGLVPVHLADLADDDAAREVLDRFATLREMHWGDDKKHNEFAQFAMLTDQLAVAGKAYRRVREADPDDAMAESGTQRVLT